MRPTSRNIYGRNHIETLKRRQKTRRASNCANELENRVKIVMEREERKKIKTGKVAEKHLPEMKRGKKLRVCE